MSTDGTLLRRMAYEQDGESDQLISKATWSLKLSGLVCGVLLVLGRSASSGNVVWNPTFHQSSAPLTVIVKNQVPSHPLPQVPKTIPNISNAALSKRAAASEVIAFSPGKNADTTTEGEGDVSGATPAGVTGVDSGAGTVGGTTGAAGTAPGSTQSTGPATGAAGTGAASAQSTLPATGAAGTASESTQSTMAATGGAGTAPGSTQSTAPTGGVG
ncbi:MAG: hypothetical protein E6I31_05380, partial [Chloroflexi bacterium]